MRIPVIALVCLAALPLFAETWELSTIDDLGDVGRYAAIGTFYGKTHVAYYDLTSQDLKYAFSDDDKTWKTEVVDANGDVGEYASIAVDLKGIPHISYYDATNHDLKYAVKSGSTWKIDIVDAGFAGTYSAIAVDSSHVAYISYLSTAGYNLKCAYGKPGNWTTVIVDGIGSVGWGSSIALDKTGSAHISYNDNAANTLRYATNPSGSFDVTYLAPTDVAPPTAIAVDPLGVVHIAFLANGGLRYTHNASGTFVTETVDDSIGPEEYDVSIATFEDGRPVITYYVATHTELRLARKNEEWAWTIKVIDKGGPYNAVCVDKDGRIRIAYFNFSDLRYAIN